MSEKEKYVIGLDFGTLSGRAVVIRTSDGAELGTAVMDYPHGVMDSTLTAGDNRTLPPEFALQVPADYLEVLAQIIPAALKDARVEPEEIVGLGVDVTSATVLVTDADGTPLCEKPEFKNNPHAYVKLWKHHGAEEQTRRIVDLAKEMNVGWLERYGGTLSSEMLMPKALETLEKAPEVYEAADQIVNALDWFTWMLTGNLTYAAGDSGYKRMYQDGRYPTEKFLARLNPKFQKVFSQKMSAEVLPLGAKVGTLSERGQKLTGLPAYVAVASGNIDAHVTAPAVQATESGQLTAIMGTSSCYVVSGPEFQPVPGTFGTVDGGLIDGLWGFEAGQTAVGDIYAWFVENCVPAEYYEEAEEQGLSIHDLLTQKAQQQEVGEHGLVALDWHNGNRSILVDSQLSGLMVGQTLATRPEDQYRAIMESTAFGARVIIENFVDHGVEITEFVAAGGLIKNPFLMQMFADVTRLPVSTAESAQAPALGSAIFAACAAGVYESVADAAAHMGKRIKAAYVPDEERAKQYDELFKHYKYLHDLFGRENDMMHDLKRIRAQALKRKGERA
ncbi:ribulokinase [Gleimia hominis]|uniref:Ribulokinase n=1 Tax=Gleimia hominis TaxID=595468 RepID=A0ABU3I9L7_9ACTO|nr:ribulokinase [Gleimia hominis]MDT3767066.1 ribulokinase [Gleimia hominis]